MLLALIFGAVQNSFAEEDPINIETIRTNNSIRIIFSGTKNKFAYRNSGKNLTLRFGDDVTFGNTSSINNHNDYVENVDVQKSRLNLRLSNDNFTFNQFSIADKTGIEIINKNSETRVSTKEDEVVLDSKIVSIIEEDEKSIISFPWNIDVAAASFTRDNRLWIVFNASSAAEIKNDKGKYFSDFKKEPSGDGSSIYTANLKEKNDRLPNVILYRHGKTWKVEISDKFIKAKDTRVVSRPFAAPNPRVDIELDEEPQDIIRFKDKYVGDELIALPMVESAMAINDQFTFVDFIVFKSHQGGIIKPRSDALQIAKQDWNYRIGGAGLNIAPRVYKKRNSKFEDPKYGFKMDEFVEDYQSILSLKSYKVEKDILFSKIQKLRRTAYLSTTPERKAKIYANWALFYLANQMYQEGLIIIKMLKDEDPKFGNSYNVKLIEAALRYMNYEYLEAYTIARSIAILEVPLTLRKEVRFWQAITSYMVSNAESYLNRLDPMTLYTDSQRSFLSEYTDEFMFEIGLTIARHKIDDRQLSEAKTIIGGMLNIEIEDRHDQNRVYSIAADLSAAMERPDDAIEFWGKCADDVEDLLNRTLCRFNRANYQYETHRIEVKEYVEELERLAMIWRGDELEISILSTLGDIYVEQKEYASALRSWNVIVQNFPFSPESLRLGRKMGSTFVKFFTEGKDEEIPDFKALALFYEFEHLVPVGEVGDKIVTKLVDHMIKMDLLDRAGQILQHQVSNRLVGMDKERAINKLAKVYLLDQKPINAILAIDSGDEYGELPDEIAEERKYVHSMALHQNKQDADALRLLKGDLTPNSDNIKAEIYWSNKDWKNFNQYVEPRIYEIRELNATLSNEDSERVLKLAISYLISGEYELLDGLIRDFQNRMPAGHRNTTILQTVAKSWVSIKEKKLETQKAIELIKSTVDQILEVINNTKKEVAK